MEAYKIISDEIKECPFCKGTDIRYSVSKADNYDRYYSQCYCDKCKCYGPRVTWHQKGNRTDAEKNTKSKQEAIRLWNSRGNNGR